MQKTSWRLDIDKEYIKTNISYPLIRTRTCGYAYQGVRNLSFYIFFLYVKAQNFSSISDEVKLFTENISQNFLILSSVEEFEIYLSHEFNKMTREWLIYLFFFSAEVSFTEFKKPFPTITNKIAWPWPLTLLICSVSMIWRTVWVCLTILWDWRLKG